MCASSLYTFQLFWKLLQRGRRWVWEPRGVARTPGPRHRQGADAHRPRSFRASSKRPSFIAVVTSLVCGEQRWVGCKDGLVCTMPAGFASHRLCNVPRHLHRTERLCITPGQVCITLDGFELHQLALLYIGYVCIAPHGFASYRPGLGRTRL